jgi:hypothetical protein
MAEIALREAAFAAIAAALEAAALTCGGQAVTVLRNEMAPAEEADLPLLVVLDGDQDADSSDTVNALYRIRAILAGYVAAETVAEQSNRINELHAKAVRALIYPNASALPAAIGLGDNQTEIWIEEGAMRVELASVLESEAPTASFTLTISFDARAPWGSPFITIP